MMEILNTVICVGISVGLMGGIAWFLLGVQRNVTSRDNQKRHEKASLNEALAKASEDRMDTGSW